MDSSYALQKIINSIIIAISNIYKYCVVLFFLVLGAVLLMLVLSACYNALKSPLPQMRKEGCILIFIAAIIMLIEYTIFILAFDPKNSEWAIRNAFIPAFFSSFIAVAISNFVAAINSSKGELVVAKLVSNEMNISTDNIFVYSFNIGDKEMTYEKKFEDLVDVKPTIELYYDSKTGNIFEKRAGFHMLKGGTLLTIFILIMWFIVFG